MHSHELLPAASPADESDVMAIARFARNAAGTATPRKPAVDWRAAALQPSATGKPPISVFASVNGHAQAEIVRG